MIEIKFNWECNDSKKIAVANIMTQGKVQLQIY